MNRKQQRYWAAGLLGVVGAIGSMSVAAEAVALEEILVTARKRLEGIQDVPMSITALDESALTNMGFANMTDLAEKVPSLSMAPYPNNSSALVIYMRGVGTVDSQQVARDPAVGVYLDDVYLGRAQGLAGDLADIQRIEILRGPQGTLYGRNTIGGAIRFLAAEPTGRLGFEQTLRTGNRGTYRSTTRVDLPEVAGVSVRLNHLLAHEGGWVKSLDSNTDFGERHKQGMRAALRWQPISSLSVHYAYDASKQEGQSLYQQRGSEGLFGALTTPLSSKRRDTAIRASELPLRDDYDIEGHALTAQWEVSDHLSLKSVTAYRESAARSVHDTMEAFGLPSAFTSRTDQNQLSQELLIDGETESADLSYTAGVFYFKEKATQNGSAVADAFSLLVDPFNPINVFRPPTLADMTPNPEAKVENTAAAAYGQFTLTPSWLNHRWSLTAGGRFSRDQREMVRRLAYQPYDQGRRTDSSFDPSLTLQYHINPDAQVYVSRLQGYRTGGFNLSSPAGTRPFKQEQLVTYEVGAKASWRNRLRMNLAIYRSVYDDMQLDFIEPLTNNVSTVNAAEARVQGVELDLRWLPMENLDLGLAYAYMGARIRGAVINPFTQLPLEDLSMPHTPRHKFHATAEYRVQPFAWGSVTAWVSWSWEDRQTTNGGPGSADQQLPSVGLVDARLTLGDISVGSTGTLNASLWGRNLTDREHPVYTLYGAEIYGEPRSYGIEVNYQY